MGGANSGVIAWKRCASLVAEKEKKENTRRRRECQRERKEKLLRKRKECGAQFSFPVPLELPFVVLLSSQADCNYRYKHISMCLKRNLIFWYTPCVVLQVTVLVLQLLILFSFYRGHVRSTLSASQWSAFLFLFWRNFAEKKDKSTRKASSLSGVSLVFSLS